jgi:hypothetical protein
VTVSMNELIGTWFRLNSVVCFQMAGRQYSTKIVRDLSAETTSVWSSVILHRPHKEHHRSRGLAILSRVVVRLGRSRAGGSREEGSRRAGRRGTAAEPIVCGCAIANRACPCRPSLPLSHSPRLRFAPGESERDRQRQSLGSVARCGTPRPARYATPIAPCGSAGIGRWARVPL